MRPVTITKQLTGGLDRDGIALAQQTAGAADLILNGALTSGGAADPNGVALDQVFETLVALSLEAAYTGLPRKITITSADDLAAGIADTNGVAASQTFTAATPLSLEAAFTGMPRAITLTSLDNISAIDFAIVGLDENGDAAGETIAGPNAGTVQFAGLYSVVTSITPDASSPVAEEVLAGWAAFDAASFDVVGLDVDGNEIEETITGPAAATSTGALEFQSVTSITANLGGGALTAEAGWATFGDAADLGSQRFVGIYSAANIAAIIFTVYGTDDNGNEISEQVTGVNNSTVSTLLNYATVTRVATSAAVASDVEVGVTAAGASPPIPLDRYIYPGNTVAVDVDGTVNYTVQVTPDNPFQAPDVPLNWFSYPTTNGDVVGETVDAISSTIIGYQAARLLINSGTDPASLTVIQSGLNV